MFWDWGGWERGKERWMEKESGDIKLQRVLQVWFSDSVLVRGGKGVQAGYQNSSDEAKTRCSLSSWLRLQGQSRTFLSPCLTLSLSACLALSRSLSF